MKTYTFHADDETSKSKDDEINQLTAALKRVKSDETQLGHRFQEVGDWLMAVLEDKPPRSFIEDSQPSHQFHLESVAIETWPPTNTSSHKTEIANSEAHIHAIKFRRTEKKFPKTHFIKFRQKYKDIPVFGALVTLEVDENYELLAINSTIGDPFGIDPFPKFKPDQLKELIEKQRKRNLGSRDLKATLYYYFDHNKERWRLVYFVENRLKNTDTPFMFEQIPEMVDYVVDAHTGELVSELPRVKSTV